MEEHKELEGFTFLTFAPEYKKYFEVFRDNGYDDEALKLMQGMILENFLIS